MQGDKDTTVMTTLEACDYLRISRPTYLKYLYTGRIRGAKVGKGWKVLRSELDRFLRGENGETSRDNPPLTAGGFAGQHSSEA
jgi:excisionase family DNA binding protein